MKTLYISWDGPGSNYLESLFLPIFGRLQRSGVQLHLMQFCWGTTDLTWGTTDLTDSVRSASTRLGIPYQSFQVWRWPRLLGTAATMVRGAATIARYARRHNVDVLMPRSIIPAGMALLAQRACPDVRLLYDADGLMADERADFDGWSRTGQPYNMLRRIEAAAVNRSDAVLTRTRYARTLLARRAGLAGDDAGKITIVSNGRDADHFRPGSEQGRRDVRASLGISIVAPLVVYAGSLGPQYHLGRMIAFFADLHARCPAARLLMLSSSPELAERAVAAAALKALVMVKRVEPSSVPTYLAAADLGLAFRTPSLSQRAVAPIKIGEYLLCGVPVLTTCGVGDLEEQLDRSVGFLLDGLDSEELRPAIDWFLDGVVSNRDAYRRRCRERGLEIFDLARAVEQYQTAFASVAH